MEGFIPFFLDSMLDNTITPFDIYISLESRESSHLIMYAKSGYRWTSKELKDLIDSGIKNIFIPQNQEKELSTYQKLKEISTQIEKNLAPKFRLMQIHDVMSHLLEAAFLSQITPEIIEKLKEVSLLTVECLQEEPKAIVSLFQLAHHSSYTYIHSASVSMITTAIALQMGICHKEELALYSLGGLLHDIGKQKIPLPLLEKQGALTQEEWKTMQKHPQYGLELLAGSDFNDFILEAIAHHHEKRDGSGYPNGLLQHEIPEHVQILTVADIFHAITTSRSYHFKRTPFEGLMFMKEQLQGKIWQESLKALIHVLVQDSSQRKAA